MNMSVSPLGIARDIAATPKVQQKCHRQRFAPKRHSTRVVSQASAQQQQTPTKNLSQEDTQRALRYQLDRSTQQTPAAVQAVQEPQYQKDLVRRQRSAREWITPWLVGSSSCLQQTLHHAKIETPSSCRRSKHSQGRWTLWPPCAKTRPTCQFSNRIWL